MKKIAIIAIFVMINLNLSVHAANTGQTSRTPLLDNKQVKVWRTVLYPSKQQQLKMHHHANDRVLVALDNGKIKIVNDEQQTHYLDITAGNAYFLPKDQGLHKHTDENMGKKPLKVVVIELKT